MLDGGGGGGGDSEAASYFPFAEEDNLSGAPTAILSSADNLESSGSTTGGLNPNVDRAHQPAVTNTVGDLQGAIAHAPASTKDNINQVLAATYIASGSTRLFATDGVQAYNNRVTEIRTEYTTEKARIVGSDDESAHTSEISELRSRLQGQQSSAQTSILDAGAHDAAAMLAMAATNPEKALQNLYGGGYLPSRVVSQFPDLSLTLEAGKLPSDLAAMTDEELAEFLLAHPDFDPNVMLNLSNTRPGVVDIMGDKLADQIRNADIDWDTDAEVLQRYTNLLQTWQDSSLAITASLYEHLGANDTLEFLSKVGTIAYQGTSDDAENLASVFRHGLGLADAMWDEQEQADFGRDLGQALEDNRRDYPPQAYESALSYLLDDQYYSAALLNPLGDKLASMDNGPQSWCNDGFTLERDHDLMSSYFSTLANNDEAGKYFFGQDDRVDQYFEREGADPFYYNNLGNALETATTENPDQSSADIVGDIVHFVGSKENNQENFSDHDLMNPELRDDMANIMKTWIASVHDGMVPGSEQVTGPGRDGDWDPVTPGKQEYGVDFDQRELAFFLGDLGKDDGAHDTVVAAEHTYAAAAYDHYMSPDMSPNDRALAAERVGYPTGSVLGALDFGAATQEHETTEANDKAHNDRVDAAFTVADSLVGLIPTDRVPLAGDAIDYTMGELQSSLQQDTSGEGNYNAGDVYDGGKTSAEAIAQAAYYRNTPDSELPPELHGHPPVSEWTDEQRQAYNDWWQSASNSANGAHSATGNAGSSYSDGYSDAEHLIQEN
jgi:hypothetical protein